MGSCGCKDSPPEQYNEKVFYPTEQDVNIGNLKNIRDELYIKRKEIINSIDQAENEIRLKIKNKQKNSAKFALQKKKLFDEYLQQLDSKSLIIMKMIHEVDKAMMDRALVGVIKNTNQLLKDIKNSIDLNEMENVIVNMQENEIEARKFNQLFHDYKIIDDEMLEQEFNEYERMVVGVNNNQVVGGNVNKGYVANNQMNKNNNVMKSQKNQNIMMGSNYGQQNIGHSSYNKQLEGLL